MKFDHYDHIDERRRRYIFHAQQILFGKVLHGRTFRSALEIGPGAGGFAELCALKKIVYTGVEVNERLAARLRNRGHEILQGDVREINLAERRFDLIFLSQVIEHLDSYETVCHILNHLSQHLHDHGFLVLLFPDVRWSPLQFCLDPTHNYPTSLESIRCLLADLGIPVVRSGHYMGRWLRGWKLLWLLHRMCPTWVLPERMSVTIDTAFMVNCYVIARPRAF